MREHQASTEKCEEGDHGVLGWGLWEDGVSRELPGVGDMVF